MNDVLPTLDSDRDREVRAYRDAIYGPCSDQVWSAQRANWHASANVIWLSEQARIEANCKARQ